MSAKNLDGHGRWRNITIGFRISPEENEDLNMRVRLSGLTKQEYVTRRCLERDIVVHRSPRVYKALKEDIQALIQELSRISNASELSDLQLSHLEMIISIYTGMKEEDHDE